MGSSSLDLPSNCTLRLHVLPRKIGVPDASLFITSALLVSHGVRECVAAVVNVGGTYLVAPSWKIRQLRPDADSREGWLRAVLRGKHRGLGAVVTHVSYYEEVMEVIGLHSIKTIKTPCGRPSPGYNPLDLLSSIAREALSTGVAALIYTDGPGLGAPLPLCPALVEIGIDRVAAGLPATPQVFKAPR